MTALAETAIARHVTAGIRAQWRELGWRVFVSDAGRWWATTTTRPVIVPQSFWEPRHTVMAADAIDADTYTELAARLGGRKDI